VIESPLETRGTKLDDNLPSRFKDIGHVAEILCGLDVVDGDATVPLNDFDIPDDTVFGGQDPDVCGLASAFWE
jgi:hypothetical protein